MPVVGLLEEYGAQPLSGDISFQPEWFPEIRKYQDRSRHTLLLQVLEGLKCLLAYPLMNRQKNPVIPVNRRISV